MDGSLEDMSQRRSQRREAAAADSRRSQVSTSADGEVRIGLNNLILGNGPGALQYGRFFLQAASLRFYSQYAEYHRTMELSNNAQCISRPALSVAQLLRQSIRSCLSRAYLDGNELPREIYARRLQSTPNVGPTVLSIHLLRHLRCAVG